MIIWYCDICGKRITDDCTLQRLNESVCEISGNITPIFNVRDRGQKKTFMKAIVCESCEEYIIHSIHETVQQAIKERRGEVQMEEDYEGEEE